MQKHARGSSVVKARVQMGPKFLQKNTMAILELTSKCFEGKVNLFISQSIRRSADEASIRLDEAKLKGALFCCANIQYSSKRTRTSTNFFCDLEI